MKGLALLLYVLRLFAVCYGQKHCCYPDQYDLEETENGWGYDPVGGVASFQGSRHVTYDFVNKKLAIEERTVSGGARKSYKMIYDYTEGAYYLIVGSDCIKTKLKEEMKQHCIPEQATYLGSSVYGIGDSGLLVDSFLFHVKNNITTHREVTRVGCIPVRELHTSHQPDDKTITIQAFTYVNVTSTVRDPSVFNPPVPPCPPRHEFTQDVPDSELLQWIEMIKRQQRIL